MLLDVTLEELGQIVQGLAMLPAAESLHRRLAAHHHVQGLFPPLPADTRRVWWRTWTNGQEASVEFYDEAECNRIDRAVTRVLRRR
jgi:hypothetical protein